MEKEQEFIEVARKIYRRIKLKKLRSAIECFTCVGLPFNKTLQIRYYKELGDTYKSELQVKNLENNLPDKSVFKHLWVEDSEMGAWQVFLLYTLWHVLPLSAAIEEDARTYILGEKELFYDKDFELEEDLDQLYIGDKIPYRFVKNEEFFYPSVKKDGEYYRIQCLYWCEFEGLVREHLLIKIKDNYATQILDLESKVIYEYNRIDDWWK